MYLLHYKSAMKVEIPSARTTRYGLKSFRYAAAKLWNELPNHFRTQTSFNQFYLENIHAEIAKHKIKHKLN
jgi:hypothetical protein